MILFLTVENTTVERAVGHHPKCEDLVVDYRRWSMTRIDQARGLLRGPTYLLDVR